MKQEVPLPPGLLEQLIPAISNSSILVGGQALAYWVAKYDINIESTVFKGGSISDDADFLGVRSDVKNIAKVTKGTQHYIPKERISALIGLVEIAVGINEYVNIDVLHKLYKLDAEKVRKRASEVTIEGKPLLVMSPVDVLASRVENLAGLLEKQNIEGIDQTRLAIKVANSFIREFVAAGETNAALKVIESVVEIAKSSAGRKVTSIHGLDFMEALPPPEIIESDKYQQKRWPKILEVLSYDPATAKAEKFASNGNFLMRYANQDRGNYVGEILYINMAIALQHIGRNELIAHAIGTWTARPKVGQNLSIQYRDGAISIEPKLLEKNKGLDRGI